MGQYSPMVNVANSIKPIIFTESFYKARVVNIKRLLRLDRLFEIVKKEKDDIDVLFASAGVGELSNPLGSITEKGFDDTFNVNVRGTLFTVQKALPLMNDGRGSIILNSSIAGVKGFPGTTVYSASKAAIRSFARTWTAQLKGKIRVNVISPGTIDTAIFDGAPQEMKNGFVSIIPIGRMGKPDEIASAALFLASDDSSFVTGIELFVDGGTAQV